MDDKSVILKAVIFDISMEFQGKESELSSKGAVGTNDEAFIKGELSGLTIAENVLKSYIQYYDSMCYPRQGVGNTTTVSE